jgi:hypothetical protein
MKLGLVFIFSIASFGVYGHGNKAHGPKGEPPVVLPETVSQSISRSYEKEIKPIFEMKCFNCHSTQTNYPWYYKVPVVGKIMESHVKEGRSHIDFTKGYPFAGHGGPVKDLEEIAKVTERDEMPPWYYTPFHKNSKLTKSEKKLIIKWSKESLIKIKMEKDLKNENSHH